MHGNDILGDNRIKDSEPQNEKKRQFLFCFCVATIEALFLFCVLIDLILSDQ